ncbi:hypothetical protein B0H17DRAFT_1080152 [Mycena rosella]|uniref:Potassium channel domain-containing protein n=1 Tax=Mycena rosella TaxID=1033263 RepID=A0AAD7D3M3_MYCRO|nr:hypothetical protein B0H17DRAFT_1080152 [Mycena rosella]
MLRYLAILLPLRSVSRRHAPDPEKGGHAENSLGPADTRPPSEFNALGSGGEDDLDEDHDLDDEHDTDDIIRGMEVEAEHNDDPPNGPSLRRGRTYTSSTSLLRGDNSNRPDWYLKLKEFLNPKTTQEDLESYVPNYRYTPILSGIVIPFSILLEIPGLTEHWYIRTVDNKIVENRPNPMILNIGLGFSMACALVANICLVVRFLETKVKLMTLGCIIFLSIHDVINITAVTIFGVEHRFNDGFTYGQSFWITVCSTVVSSFTNLTLITDLVRTPDFENSGSGLTRRQRSLAILVILLLCYIAFGALIHSILLSLNFIDAMYFTLVTIETIGFGDIQPRTTGARIFTLVYAAFGIITIALAVGLTRETVLEGLEVGYRKRVQAVRQRRKVGRWKRRVSKRWREAVEWRLRESGHPVWVQNTKDKAVRGVLDSVLDFVDRLLPWPTGDNKSFSYGSGFMMGHGLGYGNHPHGMHLNLEALSWKQLEAAAMEAGVPLNTLLPEGFREHREESEDASCHGSNPDAPPAPDADADVPLTYARLGRMIAMIGSFALAVDKSSHLRGDEPVHPVQPVRPVLIEPTQSATPQFKKSLTLQYDAFRAGMEKEENKAFYARLVVVWVLFIMFWTIGSVIFMQTEGWSFGVSLYFCFIAFTTIGYGDYSPQTPAGRSVFVVWALLGVATMTILISVISEAFSSKYHSAIHAGVFERAVKRYRERARAIAEKARRGKNKLLSPLAPDHPALVPHQSREDLLKEAHTRTQTQLEALPHKILADAKMFHEHLSYFVGPGNKVTVDSGEQLPPGLQQLMNEITGAEKLGERVKREILQDEDARHTLFTLSIEQALRKMINSAEAAIQALEEREQLSHLNQASGSAAPDENGETTPTPVNRATVFNPSVFQRRPKGIAYTRWDTTTSSEFSDWR